MEFPDPGFGLALTTAIGVICGVNYRWKITTFVYIYACMVLPFIIYIFEYLHYIYYMLCVYMCVERI